MPRGQVRGLAFVPGARLLAVGGDDGYLALLDPDSGAVVQRLGGHRKSEVLAPTFSADGRRMLTVSLFDTIQLWTLKDGRPAGAPRRYAATLGADVASLSPDGRTFAVTGPLGVEIIDAATMRRRATLPGSETVRGLARFTPDGRYIVGGSVKGWARLWSAKTYKPASPPLTGHTADVIAASTSPDGRILATGSVDGTVRLYDLRTYQAIGAPLPGRAQPPGRAGVHAPTARTCSPSPTRGATTAGTSARRRGSGRRARSPAAGSRAPSGTTRSRGASTAPACG